MQKKLVTIAFAGLVAALPFAAQAHHEYRGYSPRHHDDCDHPRHRGHVHDHHRHHGHRGHADRNVVYVPVPAPAPRVHVPVYIPPFPGPRGGVDIVWRIGF